MTATNSRQIVFIDPRVQDIGDLLSGVQPGEEVFVLDPNSDGMQQIADILAANNLTDLSSIAIISHGDAGEMLLGSAVLTEGNLVDYSSALAEIGAALTPGGAIQLYGCNVAAGPSGQQFIDDVSTLAGGATVEASTHLVGAAAQGGSWTLDAAAADGAETPATPAAAPFTAAALASFVGELAVSVQTQVWVTETVGGAGANTLVHVDDIGAGPGINAVTLFSASSPNNPFPPLNRLDNVALDTTDGFYFLAQRNTGGASNPNTIFRASLSQAVNNPTSTPTLNAIYTDVTGPVSSTGGITGLALDPANQAVYFTKSHSILEVGYNGGAVATLATGTIDVFADGLALDKPHNQAFFFSNTTFSTFTATTGGGSTITTAIGSNAIYVDSDLTQTNVTPTKLLISPADSSLGNSNFPVSLGLINGIAVDTVAEKLYFTTEPVTAHGTTGTGGIYEYDLTGNPTGTYSAIWLEPSSGPLFLSYIQIDHATDRYYVSTVQNGGTNPAVYDGALSGGTIAQTPALFIDLTMPGTAEAPHGLAIDNAPMLSVTSASPTWAEGQPGVPLITSAAVNDTDNSALPSATVSITGGFITGDVLSFSNNHNIVGSYNSTSGVLTFTGIDTFADYQTALASVTFSSGANPTDFGTDISRTLTWTVSDGLLSSAAQTTTVSVLATPMLSTTPNTTTVTLGPPVTLQDEALLQFGFNPTGIITFTLVGPGGTVDTEVVPVNGNGTYDTLHGFTPGMDPGGPTLAGTYQWNATYSGDPNNTSASDINDPTELVTVHAATTTLSTIPNQTTVTLGPPVTLQDAAFLQGGFSQTGLPHPTGTITFTLVGPGGMVDTEMVLVNGNGMYTTPHGFTPGMDPGGPILAGSYQWNATYSGDANNNGFNDVGNPNEQVTVNKATPTLSTIPNPTMVTLGGPPVTLQDAAFLQFGFSQGGFPNPTGSITFTLVGPGNTTVDTEMALVNGNGLYSTPTGFTPIAAGTYHWDATYSGDANNNGVSDINDPNEQVTVNPCYCAGTLILTDRGEVPVETLAIGDLVMTMSGEAKPVKWIGRRSYSGRFALGQKHILPICFKAGSIADGVPRRDLWISPHHAMYLEGVLIEAKDLVNGVSIVRADRVEKVEYFHIELETHDVIIAEGALSESFIDDNSRGMFHNAHEYWARHPDAPREQLRYCAPRLDEGYEVEAARRRIASRAGLRPALDQPNFGLRGFVDDVSSCRIAGWAQTVEHPEAPVCLDIYAGERVIGQVLASRYRKDLQGAGLGSGCHSFVFVPPAGQAFAFEEVEVRRSLDGTILPLSMRCKSAIAQRDLVGAPLSASGTCTPFSDREPRHSIKAA